MNREDLIERARTAFQKQFNCDPQAVGVAPGRVELLGNHTDYNEGFVMPSAIEQSIAIAGCAREVPRARVASEHQHSMGQGLGIVTFDPARPVPDPAARWADYIKGVTDELVKAGVAIVGFDAVVVSDVPMGAGVSSSAALEVATAQLLLTLYPDTLLFDTMALARLCRRAENNFVGAPVGILDMFSSLFGQADHALFLDCRTFEHRALRLPHDQARILIADSGVKHTLALGGGYRERRDQCEAAARWFAQYTGQPITTLRDVTPDMIEMADGKLDSVLLKRAHHIVYEDLRVEMGAAALDGGNLSAFGEMMSNSHESCRRYFENSAEEVDALVAIAQSHAGVYGAKMSGGGWGGVAVVLHHPEVTESLSAALRDGYRARFNRDVALVPTSAAQGADAVRLS